MKQKILRESSYSFHSNYPEVCTSVNTPGGTILFRRDSAGVIRYVYGSEPPEKALRLLRERREQIARDLAAIDYILAGEIADAK